MSDEGERLLALLASPDVEDRLEAIYRLGKSGDPAAAAPMRPLLEQALASGDETLVHRLCDALGELRDSLSLPTLMALAERTVTSAARALGRLGDPRAATALVPLLADGYCAVTAGTALGRLGDPGLEHGVLADCRRSSGRVLADAGGEALTFNGLLWDGEEPPRDGQRVSFFRLPEGRAGRVRGEASIASIASIKPQPASAPAAPPPAAPGPGAR